ncbi:MAG: hypothetical protein ACKVOA_08575 [Methylophilaceae bacterium]
MKSIFQKIFNTKADKETKKLTAWINDLPDMDDLVALKFSTQKLTQLFEEHELTTEQKLELIIEIEELNYARLDKIATQFVNTANIKQDLEHDMGEACFQYNRQAYICHLKIIELVIDPTKFKLEGNMPVLLLARTMNAAFNMTKWRMFMQQNAPTKMWLQIYMLYKIAYKQNLLSLPVEIFPLSPNTTLSAFFVQLCMLGELQQANMQRYHIEIAGKILRTWLSHAHISSKHTAEQYLFYVDLERDFPAKRMRNFEPNENCRYWELDDFEKQLNVAITVSDRGETPESLLYSKIDHVKKLNETLTILHAEWKRQDYVRQRRREERQATSKTAKVNAGIQDICDQVLQSNKIKNGLKMSRSGKSLDELLRGHTVLKDASRTINVNSGSLDNWIITDESEHGFGARVNKYANILARPDKLIGMVIDNDEGNVIVGIIQGIKPTQGNQLKVGIEVLCHNPVWVQLQLAQEKSTFLDTVSEINASHRGSPMDIGLFSGIYLPIEKGLSEIASLILPKMSFRPNTKYIIHIEGKQKRGVLGEPMESRDDWVRVAVSL